MPGNTTGLEAETNVIGHPPPHEQRVALKHDTPVRPRSTDGTDVDQHLSRRRLDESGDQVEQRRLSLTRRPHQTQKLPARDRERYILDARYTLAGLQGEDLRH